MKKKLIEVALPLEAINKEAAREKSIRHGHPSTLHLWWARRPLAACRAVLFASLVDDPSSHPEEFPTEADQDQERQRLFRLIEELVKWENSTNRQFLDAAHKEILKSSNGNPPPVYDPFCGGGSIPLEAQRLGLVAQASDLNPVAVLITKALIEIPAQFAGQPPIHPMPQGKLTSSGMWAGARGLANDIRYYGQRLRDKAFEQMGHLYPKAKLPKGGEATVIAWLWARTVKCPNPACGAQMPLVRSFALSSKPGQKAWVNPIIDHVAKAVRFEVKTGEGVVPEAPKTGRGAKFRCLVCREPADDQHIKDEGMAGRMKAEMMAIVAEGDRGRFYLTPDRDQLAAAELAVAPDGLEDALPYEPRAIWCTLYGLTRFRDLFSKRQLLTLNTLSDLVMQVRQQASKDGAPDDYADALATYLAFAVDKVIEGSSTLCTWSPLPTKLHVVSTFGRQALPMVWDFAEANPFANSSGNFGRMVELIADVIERNCGIGQSKGESSQLDATATNGYGQAPMFSTDPPYYDNIGYADLSDFFYVWLRKALHDIYPSLFSTLLVPKKQELIASPYRFDGSKEAARHFFEDGFLKVFNRIRVLQNPEYPLTIFYAFKQAEEEEETDGDSAGIASTGWETMLEALMQSRTGLINV